MSMCQVEVQQKERKGYCNSPLLAGKRVCTIRLLYNPTTDRGMLKRSEGGEEGRKREEGGGNTQGHAGELTARQTV